MTMHDFKSFFEKEIEVTTFEDEVFIGKLVGFEDELDSSSGKDEIELDAHSDYYLSLEIPDIKSVRTI